MSHGICQWCRTVTAPICQLVAWLPSIDSVGAHVQVAAEHAAVLTELQEQLQQSQKGAKRLAERGKAAAAAAAAAERDKLELQQMLDQARYGRHRKEWSWCESRGCTAGPPNNRLPFHASACIEVHV